MHCTSSTARCRQAMWHYIAGDAEQTTHMQCGGALQEFHCPLSAGTMALYYKEFNRPLPPGSMAVHCKNSTANYPAAVWRYIATAPLPAAHKQCGSALQEMHTTLTTSSVVCCIAGLPMPLPQNTVAVNYKSPTARCPGAVWRCIARIPLTIANT